jgi:hypothetical protein
MTKATKAKAPKASPVTSPELIKAWSNVVAKTNAADKDSVAAVLELAKVRKASTLTRTEVKAAIKATGKESKLITVGQIDGLVTMLELQKFPEFAALKLADQLSQANAAYKFCGAGNAEQMPTYDAVKAEVKTMRKAKNSKQNTPKTDKETKTPKAKATDAELLMDAILFIAGLPLTEEIADLLAELDATVATKIDQFNESLV